MFLIYARLTDNHYLATVKTPVGTGIAGVLTKWPDKARQCQGMFTSHNGAVKMTVNSRL